MKAWSCHNNWNAGVSIPGRAWVAALWGQARGSGYLSFAASAAAAPGSWWLRASLPTLGRRPDHDRSEAITAWRDAVLLRPNWLFDRSVRLTQVALAARCARVQGKVNHWRQREKVQEPKVWSEPRKLQGVIGASSLRLPLSRSPASASVRRRFHGQHCSLQISPLGGSRGKRSVMSCVSMSYIARFQAVPCVLTLCSFLCHLCACFQWYQT